MGVLMTTLSAALVALSTAISLAEPPLPDRPDRRPSADSPPPWQSAPPAAPPSPDSEPPEATAPRSAPAPEGESTPSRPPPRPPQRPVTLLGAGGLGLGGAAWLVEVGYPYLAFSYGQGLDSINDLGATVRFDWTTSEMLLGVLWRREMGASDGSRLGFRLVGGPWFDFGADFVYGANETNLGLEVGPGIAWTLPAGPGLFTLAGDLPLTWAFQRGMGTVAEPLLSAAYEVPVVRDVTLGVRPYLGVRWASGSARIPGLDSRLNGGLTASATWRMF